MDNAMNKEFIEAYYTAYNSEDAAALRNFYADDVVLVSKQGELRGAPAILETYRFLTGQFVDRMTPTRIAIDGANAVVDITDVFTAKQDVADFMGVALKRGEALELRLRGTYTVGSDKKFVRIVIELREP
jgi:ketosteroid isomerase-like protein